MEEIPIVTEVDAFEKFIYEKHAPAVLRRADLGPCTQLWKDKEYLKQKFKGKSVRAHVGVDPSLDFRTKNFKYCDIDLGTLVDRASQPCNDDHFFDPHEVYYLRSVSGDGRNQQVSNLATDYPEISPDFHLPTSLIPGNREFSSVLRISSGGVRIWTHYDVMDNVYCQVVGHKTATLWPPWQASNLYLEGDKSIVSDIDNPGDQFPLFPSERETLRVELEPSDVLFIPALWFHNMKAKDFGVAVNVFWKELENKFYDPKDYYGNKDLAPGGKSLAMLDNVVKQLKLLPPVYADFYARRVVQKIQDKCYLKD
eukprot:TRINITY_DN9675_c0_g1_i3.p1 TRINITY_DN9675_c0_g1~~TRINITY_DN9675_c0_g1_i3.p1  ORF type:complete len:311 (-),score=38.65 TRINITY_DN9675_c0_g1_i3:8-940(-)